MNRKRRNGRTQRHTWDEITHRTRLEGQKSGQAFALLREKDYGNRNQDEYIDWLCNFAPLVHRVLKPTGSYVIDMGGAYRRGVPVRSLYNYRVLLRHVDQHEFHLAEEFFWHNPSKLPSPIEWVNKRKLRAKDSVNTVWWLSKAPWPKANVSNVLTPYSERMKTLLKDAKKFYTPPSSARRGMISATLSAKTTAALFPLICCNFQIPKVTALISAYARTSELSLIRPASRDCSLNSSSNFLRILVTW